MQTLSSFGRAEPTGWISMKNSLVDFVGSEGSLKERKEGGKLRSVSVH